MLTPVMASTWYILQSVKISQFDGRSVTHCHVPECVWVSSCLSCFNRSSDFHIYDWLQNNTLHHQVECPKESTLLVSQKASSDESTVWKASLSTKWHLEMALPDKAPFPSAAQCQEYTT